MVVHEPARYVGLVDGGGDRGCMSSTAGRTRPRCSDESPYHLRILAAEPDAKRDYGSILVPLLGSLDEDIESQTRRPACLR